MVRHSIRTGCGVVLALVALSTRAAESQVKVMKNDKVGAYLADASGRTLYTFRRDVPGTSACAGDCLAKWPIFHGEKVSGPAGVDASAFSTIARADGKDQTAYKGMPLYYFTGDQAPGDTNGNGVRDVWDVARP